MNRLIIRTLLLTGLFVLNGYAASADSNSVENVLHKALMPADRPDIKWWHPRHQAILERNAKGKSPDLLMIGDSITHYFEKEGSAVWDKYYAPRNALNMGFSGDRTEQVLWRLKHGEVDGISPKLAVLMIGTNNSNGDEYTTEQIADGIKAILVELRNRLPETKILLLTIFPRGDLEQRWGKKTPTACYNDQWAKVEKASELAAELADEKQIFYLNLNESFLDESGEVTRNVMYDLLHLTAEGYEIWAEAMEPTIVKLMGE